MVTWAHAILVINVYKSCKLYYDTWGETQPGQIVRPQYGFTPHFMDVYGTVTRCWWKPAVVKLPHPQRTRGQLGAWNLSNMPKKSQCPLLASAPSPVNTWSAALMGKHQETVIYWSHTPCDLQTEQRAWARHRFGIMILLRIRSC